MINLTRPLIGLDMFYYAPVISDDSGGVVYDTPVAVSNAVSLTVNPNNEIKTFHADNGPREVYSQVGEIDVAIQSADLPPEDYAYLIGATYDVGTGVIDYPVDAVAPEVAIGFRAKKVDGSYRYVWMLKGKFGVPNMEHQTQEASVNFQTQTINGKFMARIYDDMVFRRVDSNDPLVVMALPGDWFVGPDLAAAPAAITVATVLPVDGALLVDRGDAFIWTFSQNVDTTYATSSYFRVYTGSTLVAGTVSYDTLTPLVVTFTPSDPAGWDAASLHVAVVKAGVRGVAHSALAADYVSTFTTDV